jgi:hypothetical protein
MLYEVRVQSSHDFIGKQKIKAKNGYRDDQKGANGEQ